VVCIFALLVCLCTVEAEGLLQPDECNVILCPAGAVEGMIDYPLHRERPRSINWLGCQSNIHHPLSGVIKSDWTAGGQRENNNQLGPLFRQHYFVNIIQLNTM